MSLVAAVTTRLTSTLVVFVRAAVQRLGLGPVVLVATAAVALLFSRRERTAPGNRPSARNPHPDPAPTETRSLTADRKPQWLSRVRKVTIGAKWTRAERCDLFCRTVEGEDGAEGQKEGVILREEIVPAFKRFTTLFDVYFIVRVDSDEAEEQVLVALRNAGMFEPGLLDERKVVFCETDVGRISVARQLEPHLHVDETPDVIIGLQRFILFVALITADTKALKEVSGNNVAKFKSLTSFFS